MDIKREMLNLLVSYFVGEVLEDDAYKDKIFAEVDFNPEIVSAWHAPCAFITFKERYNRTNFYVMAFFWDYYPREIMKDCGIEVNNIWEDLGGEEFTLELFIDSVSMDIVHNIRNNFILKEIN